MDLSKIFRFAVIGFFRIFAHMKKQQVTMTHKEAAKKALEELGGRARLKDIYPRVIPYIKYKPGSDIKATLRRLLQTTPELFRRVEGMTGWYELVSYQEKLAEKDKKTNELMQMHISKDEIIKAFNNLDSLLERLYVKRTMELMFRGNNAWDNAYKEMRKAGYFKEPEPQIILNNPHLESLYEIKGNKEVKIEK